MTAWSMKTVTLQEIASLPDIVVQNQIGGRFAPIDESHLQEVLQIDAVEDAFMRIDGKYSFSQGGVEFDLIGVDIFQKQHLPWLDKIVMQNSLDRGMMFVSRSLHEVFSKHYYDKSFRFVTPQLQLLDLKLVGSFEQTHRHSLVAIATQEDVQKIFGYKKNEFSDIAIFLSNQNELLQVVAKLQALFPNAKIVTKKDKTIRQIQVFDRMQGVFVALLVVALFTFFMIVGDRASALSSMERKEVGILKALGW